MAKWKFTIDVKDIWAKAKRREITPNQLADALVVKLKKLPCYATDDELQEIVEEFGGMSVDADFDEFDSIYGRLCDWGDITVKPGWPPRKMCWIGTF